MAVVNRRYDIAAFAAIVEKVQEFGDVTLDLGTPATAASVRLQFYRWRAQEQTLNADPAFLSNYSIRVDGAKLVFSAGTQNTTLRDALQAAGIEVAEPTEDEEEA